MSMRNRKLSPFQKLNILICHPFRGTLQSFMGIPFESQAISEIRNIRIETSMNVSHESKGHTRT